VTQIAIGGTSGSVGGGATSKAAVQAQLEAMASMLRQLGGQAAVVSGSGTPTDPLTAPFTLYVNPYIGSDRFAGGSFNSFEATGTDDEIIAQKLKRLELQRLECGYTPHRPFKTINRAVIEAAIITSKNWYTYNDPKAHLDCVSIVLAPAVHTLYNDPGSASTSLASWGAEKDPTTAELIAFNPAAEGGILLPRGCSIWSPDLRKTTLRPNWVPAVANEAADYSNRRGIFKVTGSGFAFGFTFMDKVNLAASHHLLDCFHFASKAELDAFYAKTFSAVGSAANLSAVLTATRRSEYEIVGPIEQGAPPSSDWDTTKSASFYVFNCSIRSEYGLGGIWADGAKTAGLRSFVTAQFTGVSLQKDMTCWQRYASGTWTSTTYEQYIATSPDSIRMNPDRLSRHISAINNAFIQEVSVFAIGQGVHHFTDLGGEITITNSNSSFGGCSAISKGYKSAAFPQDKNWTVRAIRVPLNLSEKTKNVRKVVLGLCADYSASPATITLIDPLTSSGKPGIPRELDELGFTLRQSTYLWVENPGELADYRVPLPASAWSSSNPNVINLSGVLNSADSGNATAAALANKRVYIRRLVDTRPESERLVFIELNNTASARTPERSFILQTDPSRVNGGINNLFNTTTQVFTVTDVARTSPVDEGVAQSADIVIRRGVGSRNYANGAYYRQGETVLHVNKHYRALEDQYASGAAPDSNKWGETFVHMPSAFQDEDNPATNAPKLIFDTDTSNVDGSTTLGINWTTVWTNAGPIRDQYHSAADYLAVHGLLMAMGYNSDQAHSALVPQVEASRKRNPASAEDFPVQFGGVSSGRANWAVEFRRASVLRLYGHAWEWAGFLNYSKSIPGAQQTLSPYNKFTYYFTNWNGGRVVPQGSNEDGFNVSPKGLEDIQTGRVIDVNNLGVGSFDDPSSFRNIDIENLTITGVLDLAGVSSVAIEDINLFPYLPRPGDILQAITLKSVALNEAADPNFALVVNGSQRASVVNINTASNTNALTIDCRLGNFFAINMISTLGVTLTFSNPPPTGNYFMVLQITRTSQGSFIWPASVRWPDGFAPEVDVGVQLVAFFTADGGTTWRGAYLPYQS
jgi:hypothetical protein